MQTPSGSRAVVIAAIALSLPSCASLEDVIQSPGVTLNTIEIQDIDFSAQTFVLGFEVSNPNPFPLPISSIDYGVTLDGERFASGRTAADISVPASGRSDIAISVELDLFRTAPKVLYLVREATEDGIPYEVRGNLGVDLPLVDKVPFGTEGHVRVDADALGSLSSRFN